MGMKDSVMEVNKPLIDIKHTQIVYSKYLGFLLATL